MPPHNRRLPGSRFAWTLLLVPFGVLAVLHWGWTPGARAGDYAQYLLHARALLDGRPYTDIGYLYTPEAAAIGPPAYPPGLPVALMPIVALGGEHSPWLRVFTLACMVAFGVAAYARLARDLPAPVAGFGSALALFVIEAQGGTLAPLSDPPFCALLWALFLIVDVPIPWTWRRIALVTLLGFAIFAFRVAGVAIVPALLLLGLARLRADGGRTLVPAGVWLAAGAFALALVGSGTVLGAAEHLGRFDLNNKLEQLQDTYLHALLNAELYPFPADRANDLYHLIITPITIGGAVLLGRRLRWSMVSTYTVAYGAMLLVVRVADGRYLWPLLPLAGASLAQGVTSLATRAVAGRWRARPAAGTWVGVGLSGAVLALAMAREAARPPQFSIVGNADAAGLYAWLRAEVANRPVRAMFHNPRVLALESGAPAMGLLHRTTPGQLVAIDEHRITHLVWQRPDSSTCLQRLADALPEAFPERFELEYANSTFRVYRVRPATEPFKGRYDVVGWSLSQGACDEPADGRGGAGRRGR